MTENDNLISCNGILFVGIIIKDFMLIVIDL